MNRRQLFTRIAAIAVAPAVVPEVGKPDLSAEALRRAFIDRQHARIQARKSQQGRMSPQEAKWRELVILKPHPSCTLYPKAS